METPSKVCRRCGVEKLIEEFPRSAAEKSGHIGYCKPCWNKISRAQRQRAKERNQRSDYQRPTGTKVCSDCHRELSTDCFYRETIRVDGLATICKECKNARRRKNEEKHRRGYQPTVDGTKKCGRCREVKSVFEFTVLRTRPDGLRGNCRACEAKAYAALRSEVFQHYGGDQPKCAGCGIDDQRLLTIDHVESNGAKHRRELNGLPIYKALKRDGFPPGYQLLCWNCNALKYYRSDEDDALLYRQRRAEPWMNRGG